LRTALEAQGLQEATPERLHTLRIERGLPSFGVEMDAETIPQEANLDVLGAISFTKGCYTGQEVVARIHFRGHVNKHLRWLSSREVLPTGSLVFDSEGKEVGSVRSSAVSDSRGPLAMAMVRREVVPGSEVVVRTEAGDVTAQLAEIA
jgi:folate-binding protein YgfZ